MQMVSDMLMLLESNMHSCILHSQFEDGLSHLRIMMGGGVAAMAGGSPGRKVKYGFEVPNEYFNSLHC